MNNQIDYQKQKFAYQKQGPQLGKELMCVA